MNNFSNLLQISHVVNLLKVSFLITDFAFIVFLVVVIRQVHTMHTIVSDSHDSSVIKSAVYLIFIIAVSLFLTALVIL